ncbi:MAG: acetyl-CoA C-acyltransferase FadI [Vicinamibacteria bacterium]
MPEGKRPPKGKRVAILAGCRTPFARANGFLQRESSLDLARSALAELLNRAELHGREVDQVVLGTVVPNVEAPNIAREAALLAGLPPCVEAYTVSRACASANQAIASAAEAIGAGQATTVIAGGSESLSNVPLLTSKRLSRALITATKARTWSKRLAAFDPVKVKDLVPVTPAVEEFSTGLTMGRSTEKMAQENRISRDAQDRFALRSHQLAAKATDDGRLASEIVRYFRKDDPSQSLAADDGIRRDTDLAALSALGPVFDRKYGTLTAGNSSPLTDGAAALLLMREDKARAEGREPLGYLRSYAFVGVDPRDQLLIGPAYSTPIALDRAGLALEDLTLVDFHEAFAAQVLSVLQALESESFCREKLNRAPLGPVDDDKLNVMGGSLALGHPFGATGARITLSVLNELRRRGGGLGLIGVCAAGGLGCSMIVETE